MTMAASLPFSIRLPEYDGPLELLLDLVRRQDVRIEDISVSLVASQFLAYVSDATQINIDLSAEWVALAARLICWKSRSLLPQDPELAKGAPDVRTELIRLLQEHAGRAAEALSRRKEGEDSSFSRADADAIDKASDGQEEEDEAFFSLWDLIRLCEEHARDSRKAVPYLIGEEPVSVESMIAWIRGRLAGASDQTLPVEALFSERPRLPEKICTFLGVLELARQQTIELTQTGQLAEFGPIFLSART
jgi:segregation and condensation protein A